MGKAIIKFNGGNLALLCSSCRTIIETGQHLYGADLPTQYCERCKKFKKFKESESNSSSQ